MFTANTEYDDVKYKYITCRANFATSLLGTVAIIDVFACFVNLFLFIRQLRSLRKRSRANTGTGTPEINVNAANAPNAVNSREQSPESPSSQVSKSRDGDSSAAAVTFAWWSDTMLSNS